MRKAAIVEQAPRAGKGGEFGFEVLARVWQDRAMSTVQLIAPALLKDRESAIHWISGLSDKEFEQVRRLLLQVEMKRLMDEVGTSVDEAFPDGDFSCVNETITEFRSRHPYR